MDEIQPTQPLSLLRDTAKGIAIRAGFLGVVALVIGAGLATLGVRRQSRRFRTDQKAVAALPHS